MTALAFADAFRLSERSAIASASARAFNSAFADAFRVAEVPAVPARPRQAVAASGISAVEVLQRRLKREAWDALAGQAKGSFQVSFDHLRAQSLKSIGRGRFRFFEFWSAGAQAPERIGQCAVLQRGRVFRIQDGLLLLPTAQADWQRSMDQLLRALGPGTYFYGGLWSCEADRQIDISLLGGTTVEHVRPFTVQGVDFSQWPSWDGYWSKVSENVRRNARYALERAPGLRIERHTGLAMLKNIPRLVQLQQESLARKRLTISGVKQSIRYFYYMALCDRVLEVNFAVSDEGTLASLFGAQIGGSFHYVYGGQRAGASGANWYLMQQMTKAAHDRDSAGRFVMGNVDYSIHDEAIGGGLLRARKSLRVTDFETSIVRFSYAG